MSAVETPVPRAADGTRLLRHTFSFFRFGAIDPTVHLDSRQLMMATTTPDGPAWTAASITE
ncbi:MAG: hypothetical protein ACKO02_09045, partial [Cyanobium sp.]